MTPYFDAAGSIVWSGFSIGAQAQPGPAPGPCGPWQMMHDWGMGWGAGGMILGPLFMILWLAVLVAIAVALVRWLGGFGGEIVRPARTARDVLDERYARGEIDRDEYLKRKQDMTS